MLVCFYSNAQETIFNENFGDGGPGTQAGLRSITTYYAGTAPNTFQSPYPIVYSGEAQIATPLTTMVTNFSISNGSSTVATLTSSNHTNSSGLGFATMMYQTNGFIIENINTLNRTNIILSFGLRVGKNQNSYTNYLKLEQSLDGVTWTPINFLAPPQNQWALITCTTNLLSNQFLKIRFKQEISTTDTQGFGTTSIDDIKITAPPLLNINNNNLYSFNIYPNPAIDNIVIDLGNATTVSKLSYKIINTLGQEVIKGKIASQQTIINLNDINGKGMYFVKIYDASNNVVETKKLIVK